MLCRRAVLRAHVETLDQERKDFGPDYLDGGWLFCWENGKPPHPYTFTRRFNLEADRQVANTLAELIIGGSLASVLLGTEPQDTDSSDEDKADD